MYRPEEWDGKRDKWLNEVGGKFADSGEVMDARVIYEAGADAMLKAAISHITHTLSFECDDIWKILNEMQE